VKLDSRIEAQERVLSRITGHEELYSWHLDGTPLKRIVSRFRSAVYLSPAEAGERRDCILTHNHWNNGGSLSYDDIHEAVYHDWAEIRAVDAAYGKYRYVLTRRPDGWPLLELFRAEWSRQSYAARAEFQVRGLEEQHPEWRYEINHSVLIRVADALDLDYRRIPWME
jgi:hypothetical protein